MSLTITEVDVPKDEAPDDVVGDPYSGDYDPNYPGSTPEAPYGFKPDGTAYKRRPRGSGEASPRKATGAKRMAATDTQARAAANMLGQVNKLIGVSLSMFGLVQTGAALVDADEQFTAMAYDALLTDPALCKKILGAGATSGKAALGMAYVMLGATIFPAARAEFVERRSERLDNA